MIDWTKPIETVPCARNPKPVPCDVLIEEGIHWVTLKGDLRINDKPHKNDGHKWGSSESGEIYATDIRIRNVAEHPLPEPTATWWARRWYDSASPDEREAMRVILAEEG